MEKSEKKKKEYAFALLRKRPMWMRVDLIFVTLASIALV